MEIRLLKTSAVLGLFRQRQPHRGQTGNRLLRFRIDPDTDALHEFISLLIKLRGGNQIDLVLRGFRLRQCFPRRNQGGLPPDSFIGGRVRRRGLRHRRSDRHREKKKTEVFGCIHRDGSRVEIK